MGLLLEYQISDVSGYNAHGKLGAPDNLRHVLQWQIEMEEGRVVDV